MKSSDPQRKGALIRIAEIYQSIQGEGLLTGTPSVFIRTSGCNLRCWFCDTPFASWTPVGDHLTAEAILDQVLALDARHVVLTGGEPMIFSGLSTLCDRLFCSHRHITIESAGTRFLAVHCDLMSISPKLSSSAPPTSAGSWHNRHHERRERLEVVRKLISAHEYQLKFVVDSPADAEEVLGYLERLGAVDHRRVLLMPQGTEPDDLERQAEWLIPWCLAHAFTFCPRAHIHWFGNRRGT